MGGKKKNNNKGAPKPIVDEANVVKKDTSKEEELNKIMTGINQMDLDKEDFVDTQSFAQSKAIL